MAEPATFLPRTAGPGEIRAAGTVLWRPASQGIEVALVHRPRYGDWTFPKGKVAPGEHVVAAAARETAEETGIRAVLGRRLPTTCYPVTGGVKRVDWWAAVAAAPGGGGAHVSGAHVSGPGSEVDEVAWLPAGAAAARLTYHRDAGVLAAFTAAAPASTPVIFIRHAAARDKHAWSAAGRGGDLARPLTAPGRAQSRELAGILRCFGVQRIVSSAALRCLATVRPYAAATGAIVDAEPAFTVGAGDPGAARQLIASLVDEAVPVAVCAHRENLPALLAAACERLGAPPPDGPPLPKGGFWVLHAAAGRLVAAEQHHLGG
jgi:8-oxo-dGTP pyrophosphatase MutT (NUDIX family)/phosphohistidine phosphatase SixA